MILPKVGETWTGFYTNRTDGIVKTFKVLDIVPIRKFMDNEVQRIEQRYGKCEGNEKLYAPMLRNKIDAGDYDKYKNVYIVHYSHNEYKDNEYHLILETELSKVWNKLTRLP